MLATLALILATAFPSNSRTSWMRPDAFHLSIGMSRADAVKKLDAAGLKAKEQDADHLVVDYTTTRSLTLEFHKNRLRSLRFELFSVIPDVTLAFDEERKFLRSQLGEPKKLPSQTVVVYDSTLPNVMMVKNIDPKSENGQKGFGLLIVRYYDPAPPR